MTTYLFPGMGADASMYGDALRGLASVKYADWPVYKKEQTISELAERLIRENNIRPGDIVGGSSLGGIVAAEISRQINVGKILLIGSTLSPDNINPFLKKFSILAEITPVNLIQALAGKADTMQDNMLFKMFSKADALFIKAMCKAVFAWQGNDRPGCPVARIHGAKDNVIYPPSTGAKIITNGGHLIAISHARDVRDFIITSIKS